MIPLFAASAIFLSTRYTMGSACPIAPNLALTAAHVIDPAPLNKDAPLVSGFWSNPNIGAAGSFTNPVLLFGADIALIEGDFKEFFPIAKEAPKLGDILMIQGFDWRKRARIFAPRIWKVKAQYRAGRMLSISENPEIGSSGTCVLNEASEVVGIMVWNMKADDDNRAGIIVLIYGMEFKP